MQTNHLTKLLVCFMFVTMSCQRKSVSVDDTPPPVRAPGGGGTGGNTTPGGGGIGGNTTPGNQGRTASVSGSIDVTASNIKTLLTTAQLTGLSATFYVDGNSNLSTTQSNLNLSATQASLGTISGVSAGSSNVFKVDIKQAGTVLLTGSVTQTISGSSGSVIFRALSKPSNGGNPPPGGNGGGSNSGGGGISPTPSPPNGGNGGGGSPGDTDVDINIGFGLSWNGLSDKTGNGWKID